MVLFERAQLKSTCVANCTWYKLLIQCVNSKKLLDRLSGYMISVLIDLLHHATTQYTVYRYTVYRSSYLQ